MRKLTYSSSHRRGPTGYLLWYRFDLRFHENDGGPDETT